MRGTITSRAVLSSSPMIPRIIRSSSSSTPPEASSRSSSARMSSFCEPGPTPCSGAAITRAGTLSAHAGAANTQRAATITRWSCSTEYSGRRAASVPTVICTSAA